MSLKDKEPGTYEAKIIDWGVSEVEKLGGALTINITFELTTGEEITWKGFVLRGDGAMNIRTQKCLKACGFSYSTPRELAGVVSDSALDREKTVELQLIRNEHGFMDIDWVNDPNETKSRFNNLDPSLASKKLASLKFGAPSPTRIIKNHAPGGDDIDDFL